MTKLLVLITPPTATSKRWPMHRRRRALRSGSKLPQRVPETMPPDVPSSMAQSSTSCTRRLAQGTGDYATTPSSSAPHALREHAAADAQLSRPDAVGLWVQGGLVGKVAAVVASTAPVEATKHDHEFRQHADAPRMVYVIALRLPEWPTSRVKGGSPGCGDHRWSGRLTPAQAKELAMPVSRASTSPPSPQTARLILQTTNHNQTPQDKP